LQFAGAVAFCSCIAVAVAVYGRICSCNALAFASVFAFALAFVFAFAFAFVFGIERASAPRLAQPRSGLPLCRRPERSPKGEATDLIAVAFAFVFLSAFSAQKTHVKPQNHLNLTNKTRSSWHVSYSQSAILKRYT
jgi:hypothetical protein